MDPITKIQKEHITNLLEHGKVPSCLYGVYVHKHEEKPVVGFLPDACADAEALGKFVADTLTQSTVPAEVEVVEVKLDELFPRDSKWAPVYEKTIHLHRPGEGFWAAQVTADTALVRNSMMEAGFTFGAHISYDSEGEFVKVLKEIYRQGVCHYDCPEDAPTNEREIPVPFVETYDHLEKAGILVEGWMPGISGVAIPVEMTPEAAITAAAGCKYVEAFLDSGNAEGDGRALIAAARINADKEKA